MFEEILEEREAPRHLDKQEPETLGLEPDTAKSTIIKLQKNSSKIMQDNALKQKLKNRNPYEKYIDIALSGTSGTVVVQTLKKIYTAWVGDSSVVVGRRDKK